MLDAAQLVLEDHGDEDDAGSIQELGRYEVATGTRPAANCALPRRVGQAALGASACQTGPVTEPYTTNGLLLAFAEMLYGDHADADAAEQAFHSTDGTFLARIEAAINAQYRGSS
jgi:hypothetical protein